MLGVIEGNGLKQLLQRWGFLNSQLRDSDLSDRESMPAGIIPIRIFVKRS